MGFRDENEALRNRLEQAEEKASRVETLEKEASKLSTELAEAKDIIVHLEREKMALKPSAVRSAWKKRFVIWLALVAGFVIGWKIYQALLM